jgi:hypothetical protein
MPNFLRVRFIYESCGERVTVLRMDTSKTADVPGDTAVCKGSEGKGTATLLMVDEKRR